MGDVERIQVRTGESGPNAPEEAVSGDPQPLSIEEPAPSAELAPRVEGLPEKFKNVGDLAKAYAELEMKQGQKASEETSEKAEETPAEGERGKLSMDDFAPFTTEFLEQGDLSEESYKQVEEWGIPKPLVEGYVQGMRALRDQQLGEIHKEVGGSEKYAAMQEWARASLDPKELEGYDSIMQSGDLNAIHMAVRGMASRWQGQTERPTLLSGETGSDASAGAFSSVAEVTAAMRDPRYTKDPSYREQIKRRLAISTVL